MNGAPPEYLREEEVNTMLAEYLEQKKGCTIINQPVAGGRGDDIEALSPQGRTLRIEVKGDGYNRKFTLEGIHSRVTSAVFNQLRRAHASKRRNRTDVYGLAFPENALYRGYLTKDMMDLLVVGHELLVFFISRDGSVELCGDDALLT
jgi:hypothetical protein